MLRRQRLALRGPQKYPYQIRFDPDMVLFMQMNEGSGAKIYDSSVHHRIGSITGADWIPHCVRGSGLYFNGVSDVVVVDGITVVTKLTFMCWFHNTKIAASNSIIFAGETASGFQAIDVRALAGNNIRVYTGGTAAGSYIDSTNAYGNAEGWTHFAFVYDGTKAHLYFNGEHDVSEVQTAPLASGFSAPLIGAQQVGPILEPYKGYIDSLRLYSRALSTQEIKDIYERTKPLS